MASLLTVTVRDRKEKLWEGEARSVSGNNIKGPFDILPQHINFISIINRKLVVKDKENKIHEFNVSSGIMQVQGNKVMIYLGVK